MSIPPSQRTVVVPAQMVLIRSAAAYRECDARAAWAEADPDRHCGGRAQAEGCGQTEADGQRSAQAAHRRGRKPSKSHLPQRADVHFEARLDDEEEEAHLRKSTLPSPGLTLPRTVDRTRTRELASRDARLTEEHKSLRLWGEVCHLR